VLFRTILIILACSLLCIRHDGVAAENVAAPQAEFHIARLIYRTIGDVRAWRPWWAIDYPEAEYHLTRGLTRLTAIDVADDSVHLEISDDSIFDHPWLFVQQPGHWRMSANEIDRIREYVARGGFVVIDDFHGQFDWQSMSVVLEKAFPDWPIRRLPNDHSLMSIFYDLDQSTQIPGRRHLYRGTGGQIEAQLRGPAQWHAVHDDNGRLVVAINFNMDMGDAWEHADDPDYPLPMTALAYRFAANYVIYAMTH